jgi:DNA helicase-2/ATP-dependent DNA helicase PcrA
MREHPEVQEALGAIGERDHSITSEYRIFGPPGTGKTTNLSRQILRAVERFGDGSVLVTSFSRAAAAELAGYEFPIRPGSVGTLHSHCWHGLGRPEIAEAHVEEWNQQNPYLRITPVKRDKKLDGEHSDEEPSEDVRSGDYYLGELNRSRGMMLAPDVWPAALREFAVKWSRYKTSHRLLDFCDLIENARREIRIAPTRPEVIFVDEAQDLNPMQLALVRSWGENAQYFILATDDDQTIYSWCGATPDAVLSPEIPEDHKIILKESHRLPRRVHARANWLIHQVSRRQEKLYNPRPADGVCLHVSQGTYKAPDYWIIKAVMQHVEKGQTVMLLVSCAYMLHPVIAVLRKWGMPFHNPYRKSNGFWNPLRPGSKGSAVNRILSLLRHDSWTHRDLKLWTEWLNPIGVLKPGAKALIEASDHSLPVMTERLRELFDNAALHSLLAAYGDSRKLLHWWCDHIGPDFHARIQFPLAVSIVGGARALEEAPQVTVGTIHSVKGGEADVVFLFPDLSKAGDVAYQRHGPRRDAVIRLFYVGMTRARETLYICQRDSSMAVTL